MLFRQYPQLHNGSRNNAAISGGGCPADGRRDHLLTSHTPCERLASATPLQGYLLEGLRKADFDARDAGQHEELNGDAKGNIVNRTLLGMGAQLELRPAVRPPASQVRSSRECSARSVRHTNDVISSHYSHTGPNG